MFHLTITDKDTGEIRRDFNTDCVICTATDPDCESINWTFLANCPNSKKAETFSALLDFLSNPQDVEIKALIQAARILYRLEQDRDEEAAP